MATAAVQLASTLSRSNTGKVPTILVYTAERAQFDTVARTFSDANALCSLFPCDNFAQFEAALDDAAIFDAAIVSLGLGAAVTGAALASLAAAAPHAAQFILSGALPSESLPAELQHTGADAIPDRNLAALPFVVDNIMRERRTTHLVQRALGDYLGVAKVARTIKLSVAMLAPGMVLAKDLMTRDGNLLLRTGQKLTETSRERLLSHLAKGVIEDGIEVEPGASA